MSPAPSERFLVTGAMGCIGAWVVRCLLDDGVDVVAADAAASDHRLRALVSSDELARLEMLSLDITDRESVRSAVGNGEFTNVVHLAAVQVPFCQADPVQGALVNVVGTVNLMDSFAASGSLTGPFVFASSVAAYDADDPAHGRPVGRPRTFYGVYKVATEQAAAVYGDAGMPSIGLRPHVVYGVGRDQGMTSSPTAAMVRAAAGLGSEISYSGGSQLQLVEDVARIFVAASRATVSDSHVFNLGGPSTDMTDVVAAIEVAEPSVVGHVAIVGDPLPFPAHAHDAGLADVIGPVPRTPLAEGVHRTVDAYRRLLAEGLISRP